VQAIVLGIHSFLDRGIRVGSQHIAAGLAESGWRVDYVSVPSSPADFFRPARRGRFQRVWHGRQDQLGIEIKPGLNEYAFRVPYPARMPFLYTGKGMEGFSCLAPAWLRHRRYDLCIHDVTVNILFLPMIRADLLVLRLNDPPEGFAHDLPPCLIARFKERLISSSYHEIWAVSGPLADYVGRLNPANRVVTLPNGVEERFGKIGAGILRREKTAVYLGALSPWLDLELLARAARLLPDWQFHVYGPDGGPRKGQAANLHFLPPLKREAVPETLAAYQVGLIPFRDVSGRLAYVERPLKFYEYIGAGLGVASTDIEALRAGMGDLACYGNTPQDFARAVEMAARAGAERPGSFNRRFVAEHSWEKIMQTIRARIDALQSSAAPGSAS
jgi:glycosyltransferase involved in cell wall biosynthesis